MINPPHQRNGFSVAASLTDGLSVAASGPPTRPGAAISGGGILKNGERASSCAVITPQVQAQAVAMSEVPTMAEGFCE